jgi:hypothetical protein
MATSKDTRRSGPDTNPFFRELFRKGQVSDKRQQEWQDAVGRAGTGTTPLRFPVYEHLYQFNLCAQKMFELLEELSNKFSIDPEARLYHQSLIQFVRASISLDIVEQMAGVEHTEAWLFQSQQRSEEGKLRDPDDVYITVRQREAERIKMGFSPRIRFIDEPRSVKKSTGKQTRGHSRNLSQSTED